MSIEKIKSICDHLQDLTVIDRANYLDYFSAIELLKIELYARRQSAVSGDKMEQIASAVYRAGLRNCGIDYIHMKF